MKSKNKKQIGTLLITFFGFSLFIGINTVDNKVVLNQNNQYEHITTAADLIQVDPIYIDAIDPEKDWNWVLSVGLCIGSGIETDPYLIKDLIIDGQQTDPCIQIHNSDAYFQIENCMLFNGNTWPKIGGIYLYNTRNGRIINNNCSNNQNTAGIQLYYSSDNVIRSNIVANNWEGIYLNYGSSNNIISENMVHDNRVRGIWLYDECENNEIRNNNIYSNGEEGISINEYTKNTTIIENVIFDHKDEDFGINGRGIAIKDLNENTIISNNHIQHSDIGIFLFDGRSTIVIENEIFDNSYYGLYSDIIGDPIEGSDLICKNNFSNNNIHAYGPNIYDDGSIGNYWDDYEGYDKDDDGIGDTAYDKIDYTSSVDNFPIWDDGIEDLSIKIDNLTPNDNFLTWEEVKNEGVCTGSGTLNDPYVIENMIIDCGGSGSGIYVKNSNKYFIIRDCTIYNAGSIGLDAGITLENVKNGELIGNNCSFNLNRGIFILGSDENVITGNIADNNDHRGIFLFTSDNNMISENMANNNDNHGIFLFSSDNNTILKNTVDDNDDYGMIFSSSNDNTILENDIIDNKLFGLSIIGASANNLIYLNNFSGNGNNGQDISSLENQWNNMSFGNWWDDYEGPDENRDGIGDIPYNVQGNIECKDYFPLVDIIQPFAAFYVDKTVVLDSEKVAFRFNGSEGNAPASFLWDFGDGTTSTEKNPTHSYSSTGIYTVTLIVTDSNGDTDKMTKEDFIVVLYPEAFPATPGFFIVMIMVFAGVSIFLSKRIRRKK